MRVVILLDVYWYTIIFNKTKLYKNKKYIHKNKGKSFEKVLSGSEFLRTFQILTVYKVNGSDTERLQDSKESCLHLLCYMTWWK